MTQAERAFLGIVKEGLFPIHSEEFMVNESILDNVDWNEVYRLAGEQNVIGLVSAGLDRFRVRGSGFRVPQAVALQFIGQTLQIEQRNKAMNGFVAELIEKLREEGVFAVLMKGQGIAQCYEKPLWRTSGDVDLLLSIENYQKAMVYLLPLSLGNKTERAYSKELGLNINQWFVELHGTQRTGLSTRLDQGIDELQRSVFFEGKVRSETFNVNLYRTTNHSQSVQVFLPAADEDVLFAFTHLLKHFYKEEGMSIRQICDWCRLLYRYRTELDLRLMESRIRKMGLMTEWQAFASVAVEYLGMPSMAMPFYNDSRSCKNGAEGILRMILRGGNRGRWNAVRTAIFLFPFSTLRFLPGILFDVNWMKIRERFINPRC